MSYCSNNGFALAGLEAGNKCTCGAATDITKATKQDLESCNVLCSGNRREFCGGQNKTLVYAYDAASVDGNGKPKSMGQNNDATITPAS